LNAFSDALQLYQSSGTRKRVENSFNQLGIYPEDRASVLWYFQPQNQNVRQEKYKTALVDLILAHRLGISTLFYCLLSYIIDS